MKRKLRIDRIILVLLVFIVFIMLLVFLFSKVFFGKKALMVDLSNYTVEDVKEYASLNKLNLNITEKYSKEENGKILSQSIAVDTVINKNDNLDIVVSKKIDYEKLKVNELGNVPIMMYHGIHNVTDNKYIGGNVDKDGYQRTSSAFRSDLEFYYQSGYRMIRLDDYVNGIIDVDAGYSPIIITFDDGLESAMRVTGLDENGEIIIDPNCGVGILEEFKKKYPDYNVTATFFVNGGIFNQKEYNEKILDFLINNGYDIGNHTYSHVDFTEVSASTSVKEVGSLYNLLDKYIEGKYVNIVALPFGSPYKNSHDNFKYIMNGTYDGKTYNTVAALRVGWESEYSCFNKNFDKTFLKRIRAYDNNGEDFDIKMNFKILEKNRYISDGDKNTITVSEIYKNKLNNNYNLEIITY